MATNQEHPEDAWVVYVYPQQVVLPAPHKEHIDPREISDNANLNNDFNAWRTGLTELIYCNYSSENLKRLSEYLELQRKVTLNIENLEERNRLDALCASIGVASPGLHQFLEQLVRLEERMMQQNHHVSETAVIIKEMTDRVVWVEQGCLIVKDNCSKEQFEQLLVNLKSGKLSKRIEKELFEESCNLARLNVMVTELTAKGLDAQVVRSVLEQILAQPIVTVFYILRDFVPATLDLPGVHENKFTLTVDIPFIKHTPDVSGLSHVMQHLQKHHPDAMDELMELLYEPQYAKEVKQSEIDLEKATDSEKKTRTGIPASEKLVAISEQHIYQQIAVLKEKEERTDITVRQSSISQWVSHVHLVVGNKHWHTASTGVPLVYRDRNKCRVVILTSAHLLHQKVGLYEVQPTEPDELGAVDDTDKLILPFTEKLNAGEAELFVEGDLGQSEKRIVPLSTPLLGRYFTDGLAAEPNFSMDFLMARLDLEHPELSFSSSNIRQAGFIKGIGNDVLEVCGVLKISSAEHVTALHGIKVFIGCDMWEGTIINSTDVEWERSEKEKQSLMGKSKPSSYITVKINEKQVADQFAGWSGSMAYVGIPNTNQLLIVGILATSVEKDLTQSAGAEAESQKEMMLFVQPIWPMLQWVRKRYSDTLPGRLMTAYEYTNRTIQKIMYNPNDILGFGSFGTIVYKGSFDGQEVAVKRIIQANYYSWSVREGHVLRDPSSQQHSNILRFFCKETDDDILYVAVELCVGTLENLWFDNVQDDDGKIKISTERTSCELLCDALTGLSYLHSRNIVHLDIKPSNILISRDSVAKISAIGLVKVDPFTKLKGTEGWMAPEMLRLEKSSPVDIFSFGCVIYYVMSKGIHPFGDKWRRQGNIRDGKYKMDKVHNSEHICMVDLVSSMFAHEAENRPTADQGLAHPFFWSEKKQLDFFTDVCNQVTSDETGVIKSLDGDCSYVVGDDWTKKIAPELITDSHYDGTSLSDLIRLMSYVKLHFDELSAEAKQKIGEKPEDCVKYFTSQFPELLLHVYQKTGKLR